VSDRFDPRARRQARRALVQALYQWQLAGAEVAAIEAEFKAGESLNRADQTFFSEVLRGVINQTESLDAKFTPLLDRKLEDLDQVELALLRLGTYELAERIEVPFKVVISEYVGLAKTFGAEASHGYVNGVLDKVARAERALEVAADG
jgi:N utilization substance protein B